MTLHPRNRVEREISLTARTIDDRHSLHRRLRISYHLKCGEPTANRTASDSTASLRRIQADLRGVLACAGTSGGRHRLRAPRIAYRWRRVQQAFETSCDRNGVFFTAGGALVS